MSFMSRVFKNQIFDWLDCIKQIEMLQQINNNKMASGMYPETKINKDDSYFLPVKYYVIFGKNLIN